MFDSSMILMLVITAYFCVSVVLTIDGYHFLKDGHFPELFVPKVSSRFTLFAVLLILFLFWPIFILYRGKQ